MTHPREDFVRQLESWTDSESLRKHCRSVEIVMHAAAQQYGGPADDPHVWAMTGLIHDADYERWPDEHPRRIVDWLNEQAEPEIAYAVSVHQTLWKLPPKSKLDQALLACDELTGFVIACCLIRPDGILSLEPKSVEKRLKTPSFAAKVDRQIIHDSVAQLGVSLRDHIQFVIDALKPHAAELGIAGTAARG